MNLINKREVVPMPSRKTVDAIEADMEQFVSAEQPNLRNQVGSGNMERVNELVSQSLTHNYESGAKALEAAIKAAEAQSQVLKEQVNQNEQNLDAYKREAAETIMAFQKRSEALTAVVKANNDHLLSMTKAVEEHRSHLQNPAMLMPQPADTTKLLRGRPAARNEE
jgi:4-aminobutyrate aminotransferase-like enzyme